MNKIAIIGANEFQTDLILKANTLGYETHVFSWGGGEPGEDIANYFYKISITEKEKILEKCREIKISAICSIASDLANITVHWVARELGLKALSKSCIEYTTDKFLMRKQLLKNSLPIPRFNLVKNINDIVEDECNFPLIVKPIDRSGSRGITKVNSFKEIEKAITYSQSVSFTDNVLIEEYISGREFSVETISSLGKHKILQVTEKFTSGYPNYIETAHLAPARITNNEYKLIENVIIKALNSLDVEFGPSHSEIKLKEDGNISIIEIGSRMGGDFIGAFLVESHTGIDYLSLTLLSSLGKNIDLNSIKVKENNNISSLVYYQFDESFKKINTRPGVQSLSYTLNKHYNGSVLSSNERFSCSKLLVRNDNLNDIITIIKEQNKSI
ncbi:MULTISPECIES: acetyl-CoA carboxylase biotin carboxylase subunit family protein [unclassified Vibrio]|uniref:ATP-grasp domain-containing protein n=1 Tax=Vibrio sp. HB236076 TaxID=3232307 RepID=A0AB39HG53_9VIBR|nr:ATP-grasp domain-containing protein [Vibrio sp. HB161653]MDP5255398.1 ATP-grasp domain-containing protein [Vibrio sp. HB161653]